MFFFKIFFYPLSIILCILGSKYVRPFINWIGALFNQDWTIYGWIFYFVTIGIVLGLATDFVCFIYKRFKNAKQTFKG